MKTKKHMKRRHSRILRLYRKHMSYPNAADPRYYRDKAIDFALTVAASMGTVTVLMFLTTLA